MNMSRRSLLAGVGCSAAGSAVGQLLSVARAEEVAQPGQGPTGGICLTMIFEDGPEVKFDAAKYVKNHLPLLRDVYGDSVERMELRTAPEIDSTIRLIKTYGGMPVVRAATTYWIKDVPAFDQRYFTEVFLPRQYSLFGSNAVRGLEATTGMDQGGQKAVLLGAFHLFIRDRKVFDEESKRAFDEIFEYTKKLTQNTMAVFNDMRVAGVA
jgi:hypothetical protein